VTRLRLRDWNWVTTRLHPGLEAYPLRHFDLGKPECGGGKSPDLLLAGVSHVSQVTFWIRQQMLDEVGCG